MERNNEERQRIGQRIAELRKAKGLTQEKLADRAGLQRTHVSRIEAGKYSVTLDVLQAIAEVMDCQVDFIKKHDAMI